MAQRSVWNGAEEECLRLVSQARVRREYGAGQAIFTQGDESVGAYCVSSGTVALRRIDANGNSVLLKLAYPGEVLGYDCLVSGGVHKASAETVGPAAVCRIDRRALLSAIAGSPGLSAAFLSRAIAAEDCAHDRLVSQATLSNRSRLCQLLIDFAERHGRRDPSGAHSVQLPVSRRDLASMIGARHETISRIMTRLEKDGLATFSGRTVTIPRIEALVEATQAGLDD